MSQRTFTIHRCLGRGGFGEVYLATMAREHGLEVQVALKLIRRDIAPGGQAAERLMDEARLLGRMRHRAVPRVYDLITLDGRLALVSEYIDGCDLDDALALTPPLPRRALLEALSEVADALHAAWHTPLASGQPLQLVHRDLKPANIRLDRGGVPKLLDLGIAWTDALERHAHTQTEALVGSPPYMAPETFDGASPAPAQDVYALGCVLYETLVGRRLFTGLRLRTLLQLAAFEDRFTTALGPRLAELGPDTPARLRQLVGAMVQHDPGARPSAAEVQRTLTDLARADDGLDLRSWCAAVRWPDPPALDSPYVGRTLVEGGGTGLRDTSRPGPPVPADRARHTQPDAAPRRRRHTATEAQPDGGSDPTSELPAADAAPSSSDAPSPRPRRPTGRRRHTAAERADRPQDDHATPSPAVAAQAGTRFDLDVPPTGATAPHPGRGGTRFDVDLPPTGATAPHPDGGATRSDLHGAPDAGPPVGREDDGTASHLLAHEAEGPGLDGPPPPSALAPRHDPARRRRLGWGLLALLLVGGGLGLGLGVGLGRGTGNGPSTLTTPSDDGTEAPPDAATEAPPDAVPADAPGIRLPEEATPEPTSTPAPRPPRAAPPRSPAPVASPEPAAEAAPPAAPPEAEVGDPDEGPADDPSPTRPPDAPTTAPEADPTPVVAAPSPPAGPTVTPSPTLAAHTVRLRGPDGTVTLPAAVAPGTYEVRVAWLPDEFLSMGRITVSPDGPTTLHCTERMGCRLR